MVGGTLGGTCSSLRCQVILSLRKESRRNFLSSICELGSVRRSLSSLTALPHWLRMSLYVWWHLLSRVCQKIGYTLNKKEPTFQSMILFNTQIHHQWHSSESNVVHKWPQKKKKKRFLCVPCTLCTTWCLYENYLMYTSSMYLPTMKKKQRRKPLR